MEKMMNPAYQNPDRSRLLKLLPRLRAGFQKFAEQHRTPGLAYGIVIDGKLVAADGIGVQNITNNLPVTPDSVFRIASMTKSFTAMAVVKLRDEGKLQLDSPVHEIVPELKNLSYPTRDSAPITVRQLLTMSGGFPQDDPWADRQLAISEAQLSEWMRGGLSFSNPPGVTFEYSNYGYAILGQIVTNAAGRRYQEYVEETILKPLGMTSTTFDVNAVAPERLAMGYRLEGDTWAEEPPLEDGAFASIGGLFTTISDFARYMAYLLDAFPPRDDEETGPVRRSSLREMQQLWRHRALSSMRPTPDSPAIVLAEGYGYGLAIGIDSVLGYSVAHGGGLPGYGTFYRILPDEGVGVVAFTNLTYTPAGVCVTEALRAMRRSGTMHPRRLQPAPVLIEMQEAITRLYEQWDDEGIKAISTESFFQDTPLEKRAKQFKQLRAALGKCRAVTPLEPENALRGRWLMKCSGGRIEVFMTLSPTVPPRIQYLTLTAAQPINPALKGQVAQLVGLLNNWDEQAARGLLARGLKPGDVQPQFEALQVQYGKLRLGDVLESRGTNKWRVRLIGQRGMVDATLTFNLRTRKLTEITFTRPRETSFVP
jgi:CubicO group peptidase (beta-lactamase class C family)